MCVMIEKLRRKDKYSDFNYLKNLDINISSPLVYNVVGQCSDHADIILL